MNAATPPGGKSSTHAHVPSDPGARRWLLFGLSIAAVLAAVPIIIALTAPPFEFTTQVVEKTAVYRIFFLHVPAAISGTTTLMIGIALGAVGILWRKTDRWSRWLVACLEMGFVALSFALISGMVWGHSVWGYAWSWEPRLTLVAVVWLLLLGALALRSAIDDPLKRERFTAIFALLIVVNAPLIKWATEWFGSTMHPDRGDHAGDGYGALQTEFVVCLLAINVLFVLLALVRTRTAKRPAALQASAAAGGNQP